ncbi:hypothetical protein JR316_0012216 [Psilocybe cubensis]|nr:hypothetical protein JR316_0012216 [Psilocybe cubensis]KAH9475105.1 hypothetical protein JR316_0012216 [Psilocybe cubensis]
MVAKAKESPLSITVSSNTLFDNSYMQGLLKDLTALSRNWVALEAGLDFMSFFRWKDLYRNLEELTLLSARKFHGIEAFFDGVDPSSVNRDIKLHSFTATSLPHTWIRGFLGPQIRRLSITDAYEIHEEGQEKQYTTIWNHSISIWQTMDFLKHVPYATSVELNDLNHIDPIGYSPPVVRMQNLQRLELKGVQFSTSILSSISAPSLQTLCVDSGTDAWNLFTPTSVVPMASFFSQWSQPGFIPTHLHTLDLVNCLNVADIPFLIRWLGKLPNLVRLLLLDVDNILQQAAFHEQNLSDSSQNEQFDFLHALAHPAFEKDGKGTWLCPSLMVLRIYPGANIGGLRSIAQARGGVVPYSYDISMVPPPARLRQIETQLCFNADRENINELVSLADHVYCRCLSCGTLPDGLSWSPGTT